MFNNKINISKFVNRVKDELSGEFSEYRQYLECIKNDTEFLTEEEKKEIIVDIVNHGWGVESALESHLKAKYRKEAKIALVSELFPEIYEEICKGKED